MSAFAHSNSKRSNSAARPRRSFAFAAVLVVAALAGLGCQSTVAQFSPLGKTYPAKPGEAPIEVFEKEIPSRPFERIARLDVHLEKTGFIASGLSEALPKLRDQARRAGADAIIEIKETRSSVAMETKIYHVTATAIRFTDTR